MVTNIEMRDQPRPAIQFDDRSVLPHEMRLMHPSELGLRLWVGIFVGAICGVAWTLLCVWLWFEVVNVPDPCVERPGLEVCQGGAHG